MFDNCLKKANNHFSKNIDRENEEPFKLWDLTFIAKPKKGVNMEHNWNKQQEWNGDCYDNSEETSSVVNVKHGDAEFSVEAANDHWGVGVEGDLLEGDWKVEAGASYQSHPASSEWSAGLDANIKSPDMGGVKAFMNLHLQQSHADKSDKSELEAKVNLKHDNHFVGVSVGHDTKEWQHINLQAVMKDSKNKYFARCNVMDEHASVGCTINKKGFAHSYAAYYMWSKEAKGIQGLPVKVEAGGNYRLDKKSRMSYSLEISNAWQTHASYWYKLNKHWKVAVNQNYDSARLVDSSRNPHDLGFELSYKL